MMKKKFTVFLALIFLAALGNVASAEERVVQLTVPGCAAWGASHRIGAILKEMKGVKKYQFEDKDILIVTFDDNITTLDIITNNLEKGGNKIIGKPVYTK